MELTWYAGEYFCYYFSRAYSDKNDFSLRCGIMWISKSQDNKCDVEMILGFKNTDEIIKEFLTTDETKREDKTIYQKFTTYLEAQEENNKSYYYFCGNTEICKDSLVLNLSSIKYDNRKIIILTRYDRNSNHSSYQGGLCATLTTKREGRKTSFQYIGLSKNKINNKDNVIKKLLSISDNNEYNTETKKDKIISTSSKEQDWYNLVIDRSEQI